MMADATAIRQRDGIAKGREDHVVEKTGTRRIHWHTRADGDWRPKRTFARGVEASGVSRMGTNGMCPIIVWASRVRRLSGSSTLMFISIRGDQ
jgi:hypothetical protein